MKKSLLIVFGMLALVVGAAETTVESKNTLGIKRTAYASGDEIVVSVPWLQAADKDTTVAELITTGLTDGDQIQVYDLEAKDYFSWHYDGTEWTADTLTDGTVVPSANEYPLQRGTAFWYKPASKEGAFTQVGTYSEAAIETKVNNVRADGSVASFAKPVSNLLTSPKPEPFDIRSKLTKEAGCKANDVVVLIESGRRCRFNGEVWGEEKIVTKTSRFDGKEYTTTVFDTEAEIKVSAGKAFWYMSAGGAPTFEW